MKYFILKLINKEIESLNLAIMYAKNHIASGNYSVEANEAQIKRCEKKIAIAEKNRELFLKKITPKH